MRTSVSRSGRNPYGIVRYSLVDDRYRWIPRGWVDKPEFKELLIRWFQFGTFCPVMRIHGCRQPAQQIINKAGEVREWTGADNEIGAMVKRIMRL